MTAPTAPVESVETDQPAPEALCSVCNHPTSAHDRTASRFCDATQSNALTRGCICRLV